MAEARHGNSSPLDIQAFKFISFADWLDEFLTFLRFCRNFVYLFWVHFISLSYGHDFELPVLGRS